MSSFRRCNLKPTSLTTALTAWLKLNFYFPLQNNLTNDDMSELLLLPVIINIYCLRVERALAKYV